MASGFPLEVMTVLADLFKIDDYQFIKSDPMEDIPDVTILFTQNFDEVNPFIFRLSNDNNYEKKLSKKKDISDIVMSKISFLNTFTYNIICPLDHWNNILMVIIRNIFDCQGTNYLVAL